MGQLDSRRVLGSPGDIDHVYECNWFDEVVTPGEAVQSQEHEGLGKGVVFRRDRGPAGDIGCDADRASYL